MEFFFFSMLFLFAIYVFMFCKFLVYMQKRQDASSGINLPPGSTGWPIIGESFELVNSIRKGVPEKFISDRVRAYSSEIFKTSLFFQPVAVFCSPAGHKFLFSNENKLVRVWWPSFVEKLFPSTQLTSGEEERHKLRTSALGVLKLEALQRYIGVMDSAGKEHLETRLHNVMEVMVSPLVSNFTFSLACRLFLSINDPARVAKFIEPFGKLVDGIMSVPIDLPGTTFNGAIKASKFLREEIHSIIKQRKIDLAENKASPTQDMLSIMLLSSDENGEFTSDLSIVDRILGLLVGGHTSSKALTAIVKYLAEFPHFYNEVLREQTEIANSKAPGELLTWADIQKMKYSWNVASETMRLETLVPGSFKEVVADFTYLGYSVPKGWKIYWTAGSTHKNPQYFPDPEKFDPSRFEGEGPAPYTFIPFGGGPRMCPGREYAHIEILVFMHHMVRMCKWEKSLPDEKNLQPVLAKGLQIRLHPHKY
ncbi:hypothetical protein GIB67_009830 [Kingdonia uniflora]|uniref:Cytochrome P450 n=1 Tax=Kingdonia uniflora TaxID=39325 RepID=A0A7J7LMR0_9MAGN|nr:hypothetical protein GIB67_009830 [Kingdonia uniflora]